MEQPTVPPGSPASQHQVTIVTGARAVITKILRVALGAMLIALSISALPVSATAAPGDQASLYLGPSTEGGVVGSYEDAVDLRECPSSKVLVGVRTENRNADAPSEPNSILTRFDLLCATVTVSSAGDTQVTPDATWLGYTQYDQSRGNIQDAICPTGTVAHRMTGTTFVGAAPSTRWPSQVQLDCRALVLNAQGQMRVDLSSPTATRTAGTNFNTNGGLQTPAYQCGSSATTGFGNNIVRGYRPQGGGEGIEGFNPSCASIPRDFGDAPASYGSASHELNAATYLGWSTDPEAAQQSSSNASADDTPGGTAPNQTINDENGVPTLGPITAGVTDTYSVNVLASNKSAAQDATLVGWIDFNDNGAFEAAEGSAATLPSGTPDGTTRTLTWTGVAARTTGVFGQTFARFRVSTDDALTTATPTGASSDGEVEDYPLTIDRAVAACADPIFYANTGGGGAGSKRLLTYNANGTQLTSLPIEADYGDIAVNPGATAVYGVAFFSPSRLDRINPTTGAVVSSTPITDVAGAPAATGSPNALSFSADGQLLLGAFGRRTVYKVNPATGVATTFATLPAGYTPAGDFLTLPDGDIIALTNGPTSGVSTLLRLHPDGTSTPVGTVPRAFGAGLVNGAVYLAGVNGTISRVASIPTAESTTTPIASTALNATGLPFYGAAAVGDAGGCTPSISVTKALDGTRLTPTDQFTVGIRTGSANGTVVSTTESSTTTGSEATVTAGSGTTGTYSAVVGTSYYITERGDGGTDLANYRASVTCTDTNGIQAGLPTNAPAPVTVVPQADAAIECVLTNQPQPDPSIALSKTVAQTELVAGDTLDYRFTATNTGNTTLSDVSIAETAFTGSGSVSPLTCTPGQPAVLAPGATLDCTATYQVTQADVDDGAVSNTAATTGTPPTGPDVTVTDDAGVPQDAAPGISVVKRAGFVQDVNGNDATDVGDRIGYVFDVTNSGNVTLTGVAVDDPKLDALGITISCGPTPLAPGARVTCEADDPYVVTQADVDAGGVTNSATATGTPPGGGTPPTSPPSQITTPTDPTPGITVVKVADRNALVAGQTITYTITATNTGNTTLTGASVTDDTFSGSGDLSALDCNPNQPATLAPDAALVCQATYQVTQADVDRGTIENTASATGTPSTGPPVSDGDQIRVPGDQRPGIAMVKRVGSVQDVNGNDATDMGDRISYVFDVTNTGNVTLTGVAVDDPKLDALGITISCDPTTLAAGGKVTCTADDPYAITQADIDAGGVNNVATATGIPPGNLTPPTTPPSQTVTPTDPAPGMTMDKKVLKTIDVNGNKVRDKGDEIRYGFVVTNTGRTTLRDVAIDDAKLEALDISIVCDPDSLAPGQTVTCEATEPYVITARDVAAGRVVNVATATSTPPGGLPPLTTTPSRVSTSTKPSPPAAGGSGDGGGGAVGGIDLPDTGGPALLLLAGGLIAVGAGTGVVVASRRQRRRRDVAV